VSQWYFAAVTCAVTKRLLSCFLCWTQPLFLCFICINDFLIYLVWNRPKNRRSRKLVGIMRYKWMRSADSTVAERIRERSLLLVYSFRSSNSSERSRIRSATLESAERDHKQKEEDRNAALVVWRKSPRVF